MFLKILTSFFFIILCTLTSISGDYKTLERTHPYLVYSALVRDLKTGQVVFEKNAQQLMKPASLQKIPTAYVALKNLGPDFCFKTRLSEDEQNTYFYFSGDPTLTFQKLVDFFVTLKKKGMRSIKGDLYLNQDLNLLYPYPSGWTVESTGFLYGSMLSPININRNGLCFSIHPAKFYGNTVSIHPDKDQPVYPIQNNIQVGGCTKASRIKRSDFSFDGDRLKLGGCVDLGDSSLRACVPIFPHQFRNYVQHAIREALHKAGLQFKGKILFKSLTSSNQKLLGVIQSDPLKVLLNKGMKDSRNVIMESLIFPLIAEGHLTVQTETAQEDFLKKSLAKVDVSFADSRILDMSGLSHHNLMSAHMIDRLLWTVYKDRSQFPLWCEFLAISGRDGTLKERFLKGFSKAQVRGKTGALLGVQNFAGYVWHKDGPRFSFVIMVQNFTKKSIEIKKLHELFLASILRDYGP